MVSHCNRTSRRKKIGINFKIKIFHPKLRHLVKTFKCDLCQRHKLPWKGYGLLPERDISTQPFQEVAVDLIIPWSVKVGKQNVAFMTLTIIDPVTNLTELVRVDNKTAKHVSKKFAYTWLTRYPWPEKCIHDNGGEFTGWEFQKLLEQCKIEDTPTTSRNPTANAICERMHQTVGNIIRTLVHEDKPRGTRQAKD